MKNLLNVLGLFFFFVLVHTAAKAQWTVVLNQENQLNCLAVINTDTVLAGGNNQIMRSCNGGETWLNVLPAGIEINVFDMAVSGHAVYASGNGKILKSTDNGQNWTIVRQSPDAMYQKLSFFSYIPNKQTYEVITIGLALAKSNVADTLLRTMDGGVTWQSIPFQFPAFAANQVHSVQMVNGYTGYLLTDTLYKTSDMGLTWQQIPSFGSFTTFYTPSGLTGNVLGFVTPDIGIIINYDYNEWKKTIDGGITWEVISRPYYCASGICAMNPDVFYVYLADAFFSKGGVYVSTNEGAAWEAQNGYNYGRDIEMATDSIGYYLAWSTSGPAATYIYKTIHGGWLWTGMEDCQPESKGSFLVTPNPVSDQLTITAVKGIQSGIAKIKISDIYGKKQLLEKLNTEKTTIAVSQFQSGTYLYEISLKDRIIQKGIFIKK